MDEYRVWSQREFFYCSLDRRDIKHPLSRTEELSLLNKPGRTTDKRRYNLVCLSIRLK